MQLLQPRITVLAAGLTACLGIASSGPATTLQEDLPSGVGALWRAESDAELTALASRFGDTSFDELAGALVAGPSYEAEVPRGVLEGTNPAGGADHHFAFVVPDSYRPETPTAVRVMLHGGVSSQNRRMGARGPLDNLRRRDEITVLPSAWARYPWWGVEQLRNLRSILIALRQRYNIDENRVHLAGISDGGTGAWYVAMLDPTPWAGFVPLIGHPAVLQGASPNQLHALNLRNRPFFVVNTGNDRLYPDSRVSPWMRSLKGGGVAIDYQVEADYGHDTNWWPNQRAAMDEWVSRHPRVPHPPTLQWAVAEIEAAGRFHWLVVRDLGDGAGGKGPKDWNERDGDLLFPREAPVGTVRAERRDNRIRLETRGLRKLDLLLSAEVFDLGLPLRVEANGDADYEVEVVPDKYTLLKWFAEDRDRTMLYAATVEVDLVKGTARQRFEAPPSESP
jgi:poly(3-hydroxybutyrate) depolymerase